jgi:hypothetical protein
VLITDLRGTPCCWVTCCCRVAGDATSTEHVLVRGSARARLSTSADVSAGEEEGTAECDKEAAECDKDTAECDKDARVTEGIGVLVMTRAACVRTIFAGADTSCF